MSLLSNHPTFSYISANGISVIYNKKMYTVQDFNTNKQFIYWNIDTPSVFRASNNRPDTYDGQFLVLVNENGTAIEIPNEKVQVYFDGNSVQSITDRIYGIYETDKEHGDRFVAIEQNVDRVSATVGKNTEDINTNKENISKVDLKADGINLSVKEVTKNFSETEIRDELNGMIIKLNSNLGIFKGDFLDYAKDNSISTDEKNAIEVHIGSVVSNKSKLDVVVNKVIQIAVDKNMNTEKTRLESAKSALIAAHDSFVTNIRNVISDNVITPSDRTIVIDSFARYNLRINELKNACDSIVILGMGGSITEELSQIGMRSDGIDLEVSKKVDGTSVISAINMSPESIKIKSTKIEIDGLVTFSNLTDGTTTISGSNIKTGTIDGIRVRSFLGNRGVEMYSGYVDFYNGSSNLGWMGYDNSGSGSSGEARDRLWITTRNGYAMKLQSSGDMSIEAGTGGQGTGTVWVNKMNVQELVAHNQFAANIVATFG